MQWKILDQIHQAERELWATYARHHEIRERLVVYDTNSPTHLWSNSVYGFGVQDRLRPAEADLMATYYQVHGLEGFWRDYHGDFSSRTLARYSYFWLDPHATPVLSTSSSLRLERAEPEELETFSEEARLCHSAGPEFVTPFRQRLMKLMTRLPVHLLRICLERELAGVMTLATAGGLTRIIHFALKPEWRGGPAGTEVLQGLARTWKEGPLFAATEVPRSIQTTFPAAGFHLAGSFGAVPLNSLQR